MVDFYEDKIEQLIQKIENEFIMHYNTGLQLITIKNYNNCEIPNEIKFDNILLEQKTRNNIQYLVK